MPPEKIEALQFASGGVFERYMTHAIDTLENKYGCVCGYLTDELGLTEPDWNSSVKDIQYDERRSI